LPETDLPLSAFVLMPFERQFDALYEQVLVPALTKAGYEVGRADSVLDQRSVMQDIVEGIARADLIIAELTHHNANVYYELGIAHALRKATVALTQDIDRVPFDLKAYRLIVYSPLFDEIQAASERLTKIAVAHAQGTVRFGSPVSDYLDPPEINTTPAQLGKEYPTSPDAETVEAEKGGVLDWLTEFEDHARGLNDALADVAEATQEVGLRMEGRNADLEKLAPAHGPTPALARKVALGAASDLDRYAEVLEQKLSLVESSAEGAIENGINLAEHLRDSHSEHPEERTEFRGGLEELRTAVTESTASLSQYRETVSGLKGITKPLNKASRRVASGLDRYLSVGEKLNAFCERGLAIVPAGHPSDEEPETS